MVIRVKLHCLHEMEESGSDRPRLASVRDDKLIYINYSFLPSKQSDGDCFLSISMGNEVSPCSLAGFEDL